MVPLGDVSTSDPGTAPNLQEGQSAKGVPRQLHHPRRPPEHIPKHVPYSLPRAHSTVQTYLAAFIIAQALHLGQFDELFAVLGYKDKRSCD